MSCPLQYSLDAPKHSSWTAAQEKMISREYPFFDLDAETPDQYVVRTYLQFLWLPDSIMPVKLLVPSLLRVNVASSSQYPTPLHPLHALLDPLLLTPRSAAKKYHVELPQILSDGCGAGEIEENMMWFALNYEKSDGATQSCDEGPWSDEAWRKRWLERLERREVQIQILLYLLILSLPQPLSSTPIPDTTNFPPPRSRARKRNEPQISPPSVEDRLESFMDKLSMWQLVDRLDADRNRKTHTHGVVDDRDWMQVFCEDLVEPHFKSKLPEAVALLRKKVFQSSPFSDDDSSSGHSRPASPGSDQQEQLTRGGPSLTSAQRHPSPALSSRSRSLSVTLALDADARKSVGAGVAVKKRVLNREVSMSRVFKAKSQEKGQDSRTGETKRVSAKDAMAYGMEGKRGGKFNRVDTGTTLVAATPVKAKNRPRNFQGSRIVPARRDEEEEDIWEMPGSPDVLLLCDDGVDEGPPL